MRWFAVLIWLALLPAFAVAAEQPFASRPDMESFVDEHMLQRDFGTLIRRFDGPGEYSDNDIASVTTSLRRAYPQDFTNTDRIRYREMGEGFREEVIVYWRPGGKYIFLYILSHEAPEGIHILTFALNSRAENVLPLFQ